MAVAGKRSTHRCSEEASVSREETITWSQEEGISYSHCT